MLYRFETPCVCDSSHVVCYCHWIQQAFLFHPKRDGPYLHKLHQHAEMKHRGNKRGEDWGGKRREYQISHQDSYGD